MAKPLKKALKRLAARQADYERTVQTNKGNSNAFTKPGSMKKS